MPPLPRIALLIETSRRYGRGVIEGVMRHRREHTPRTFAFSPRGAGEPPPAWLRAGELDGVIARIDTPAMAQAIERSGLPAVDLSGLRHSASIPFVGVDNRHAGRMAADHLLERGLRRFGFYGLPRGADPHMDDRRDAFVQALADRAWSCAVFESGLDRPRPNSWDREMDRLARWLATLEPPVGVMACHDDLGVRLIEAATRAGLRIPDELAVLSADNDEHLCALCDPPLSSLDTHPEKIGYEAARLLDQLLRGKRPPKRPVCVSPRGVVTRRSTDAVAVADARIAHAVQLIRDRACAGLQVNQLLQEIPMSRSAFERSFKSLIGRTPKAQIMHVRFERAKTLLRETDLTLENVAARTGFGEAKHLCAAFQKTLDTTPGRYRSEHAGSGRRGAGLVTG